MLVDRVTGRIERSSMLDAAGKQLARSFSAVVRPGRLKDLLTGTWMGHPVHPMLTDVPIGAWTSALLLDLLAGDEASRAADVLVGTGVLAAVPTAVTGLADLTDVVTKEERSVGVAHAAANVGAVALFGISFLARRRGARGAGRRLAIGGAAAVTIGGFLGGHLSYRRGVGVDHTAFEDRFPDWTAVLDDASLPEGRPMRVRVEGTNILLYRTRGTICALANRCSHRGGPLHKGRLEEGTVRCPWHLSTFRLDDGSIVRGPATAPQPSYRARVQDGRIEIRSRR
jgi:nitrite reductase/ring-hydroxylating ferredoxin subunit/uncharacterized membrane protein